MQPGLRVRLSVGPSLPVRLIGSVVALVFIGGSAAFMLIAFGIGNKVTTLGTTFDQGGTSGVDLGGFDNTTGFLGAVSGLMGLCAVPFLLIGFVFMLYLWRVGAWLDGTRVSYRKLGTRHVDLATASVTMSGVNYVHQNNVGPMQSRTVIRVPALAVAAPGSHRPLKIPLRGQGLDLLPPNELRALADALLTNTGPESARARAVGDHLRKLADDPLVY
jgi:hypothetical protein